jgi:predicted exporter
MTLARSSRWAIALWVGTLVGCAIVIARTEFTSDMSAFLPRSPTPVQQILVQQLRDGVVSRLILVAVDGGTPAALAQTSMRMAAELRKHPAEFAAVNNGEDSALDQDREFLWRNRYLLSPAVAPGHFSAAALRDALEENLQLIGSPAGALLRRILPQDPTGELLRLIAQFESVARPDVREGVWFSPDGGRALLVAQTRAAGYDIDAQERALNLIRAAFAGGDAAATSAGQKLLVSGPGIFSVSSRARIKADALRFSVIATVLVAGLLLVLYRSPRVLLLGLVPVASGVLAGVAAVGIGFGTVHGITLGFGVTLIGEAVDYAIYLFTQITPGTAPADSLAQIWPTLRLGLLTSICGFAAMLLSGFPGLGQLGLFSIAGLVTAVLVTRFVLPVLLPPGFTVRAATGLGPGVTALAASAQRLRWPLIAVTVVCIVLLGAQRGRLWSDDLASLSPLAASERALDEQLRRDIGAPDVRYLVVVDAADADAALAGSEQVAVRLDAAVAQGRLAGFETPAAYLPSSAAQRARQAAIPAPAMLSGNLREAQRGLPFRTELFEPFVRDAAAAATQPLLDRASLEGTALALKVDSLLVKRTASATAAGGWTAMLPLRGVVDAAALERDLKISPDHAGVLIDLKRESNALYQTYRRAIVTYSLIGAVVIVILLLVSLRSARRVAAVLAPLAAAVVVTLCLLLASGNALTIFHIVGLLLVVAVGSNYALFFERQAADAGQRERTLVSLLFANVTTLIGFGLLAFSKVPLLHAIGGTVAIGALLSLVFSAVLIGRPRSALAGPA